MQPDQIFIRMLWRSVVSISPAMGNFTNWTIAGVAAFTGLVLANLGSLSTLVEPMGLKLFLYFSVASVFMGAVSRQIGVIFEAIGAIVADLDQNLNSKTGQALISKLTGDLQSLGKQVSEPFWWPLSLLIQRSFQKGTEDPLTTDRRFVQLWCLQFFSNVLHLAYAFVAVICLAGSID